MIDADPDLLAFLREEESRAYDGTLLEDVEAAINSYNGAEYGDEEDGRSQVVARDVAESADYMLTSIMDVMAASGNVIEFEPQSEGDEDQCDDATQALHILYRKRQGFRKLHDWAKAGLLEKIAIIKTCAEQHKQRVEGLYHPALIPDHAIEAEETGELHPEDLSPMFHAVTLEDGPIQFNDYPVPLEEFGFSPDTTADLDQSPYLNHHPLKTLSELVQMGYPREVVETLSDEGSDAAFQSMQLARDDGRSLLGNDRQGMLRKVRYLEEYVFYDLDNDGIAERLKICRVGNTILNIEPLDEQPFEVWCCFPMQGRLVGQSFADKTMDIQRVNTVLERSMLDSLYAQLRPGTFLHEDSVGDHTVDDILTIAPNRIVRFKGSQPPIPEVRTDVSGVAIQAIEFKTRQRESRTGITRLNKGVDEDTLNDTAKGQAQLMSRGQQMERYVIRQFAEAFGRLAMKKVRLLRKYSPPFQIRVDGQYRQVDPGQWPEDMEVNVRVGLGSGSKEDRIMGRQTIGQVQALLKQSGSQIVSDDNLYNNVIGLARDFGLQPNDLFTEPPKDEQGNPIPQQAPPDPKVQALMMQVQVKQQAIEAQKEADAAKLQQMAMQHADETQIELIRQHQEAALAIREQNLQAWLDQQQMILDAHKHAATEDTKARIAKMRPGGSLAK